MKRYLCMGLIILLLAVSGCAHFNKKESTDLVGHQDFTPRFIGYKVAAKTKATPSQLEAYLLDTKNLDASKGAFKLKILNPKKLEKVGDRIDMRFDVAGLRFPGQMILVDRDPGKRVLLIGQIQLGAMAKMRLDFKELGDGTKVSIAYEVEDVNSMIGSLAETVNYKDIIAKVTEELIAKCQAHFDPSLNADELMAGSYRGEFYDAFFQGHTVSVWINKPPKKVMEYLANPKSWESWNERTGNDFGACIALENLGPCLMHLSAGGVKVALNSFSSSYKYADHSYAYAMMGSLVIRNKINLKPDNGGSVLSFSYLMELPGSLSEEGGGVMMKIMQVPKMLEDIMLMMKNDMEGTV